MMPPSHGWGGMVLPTRQGDPLWREPSPLHTKSICGEGSEPLRLSSEERATKRPCLASAVSTVALNFQTPGYEMDLNAGRFLVNGQCGYILKPVRLRSPNTTFDPECPGPPRTTLTIQVRGLGRALPGVPSAGVAPARGQRRPGEGPGGWCERLGPGCSPPSPRTGADGTAAAQAEHREAQFHCGPAGAH